MKKLRIGILGASDIAFRRFLPSLIDANCFEYVGVASRDIAKTIKFKDSFGGIGYDSYESLLEDKSIDAVYIPLPPSLHFKWAMKALNMGKHILLEKPFSTNLNDTNIILEYAMKNDLAVHENYTFLYHTQLKLIENMINDGIIGEVRLYRTLFGFPFRSETDFRYNKSLGGGSLFDCGGYPIKLASHFLGKTTRIECLKLYFDSRFDVDISGSATLTNDSGDVFQVGFGMDHSYKCELEVWGSKGIIRADRIFTAGSDFAPTLTLITNVEKKIIVDIDDQFRKSIERFHNSIINKDARSTISDEIRRQASLIEAIYERRDQ